MFYKLMKSIINSDGNKQWVELGHWGWNPSMEEVCSVQEFTPEAYETLNAGCIVIQHPLNSFNAETYKLTITP